MAEIRLSGIDKVYPGGTHAVHSVDLHVADGEFMIMVGPSGCAKSTILRMIAGLETPTGGTVEIGGRVVNDVAPKDRDIAMVFQSYALYPHMTVRENMSFGLRLRRMPQNEIDVRVADAARILGLENLLDRLPKAMSGGQRQRVAMGRAIVREPQAFLMDEPLSNLDAKLRVQMRTEIARLHQRLGTTTVYVTHDQVEALTLGQRICILRKGVVQQVDTPFQVYENPANVFVGGFIGSPGMNFLQGRLVSDAAGAASVELGGHVMRLPESVARRLRSGADGRSVIVGIRPEHLSEGSGAEPDAVPVQVDLTESMGADVFAYFSANLPAPDLTALSDTQATNDTFVARLPVGTSVRAGAPAYLRLDLARVHIFDAASMDTLLSPIGQELVLPPMADHQVVVPRATPPHSMVTPSFGQPQTTPAAMDEAVTYGTLAPATADIAAVFDAVPAVTIEPLVVQPAAEQAMPEQPVAQQPMAAGARPSFANQLTAGTRLETGSAPRGFQPRVIGSATVTTSAPEPVAVDAVDLATAAERIAVPLRTATIGDPVSGFRAALAERAASGTPGIPALRTRFGTDPSPN